MKSRFHKKSGSKKGSKPIVDSLAVKRDENPSIPPTLTDQLCVGFVFRYVTTAQWGGSYTVTFSNLLDSWFIAGTATTAYQLFDFVKVKKVVVRAVGTANAAVFPVIMPQATVSVEFPGLVGGQFGSGKQRMGTGLGYDQPAWIAAKPDPLSQSAQFQPSTANAAFIVRAVDAARTGIEGAVIDVHVVLKNSGDISPAAVSSARAGLTPGLVYFGGMDGLGTATTIAKSSFIPIA